MLDIFDRLKGMEGPLEQYRKKAEGYFMFPELEGEIGPRMKFHGREVITWSLNNYLGLANHPEVRKADAEAAAVWGMAYPMGARMMSGQTKYHKELEERLAKFERKEAAYLLNYGYQGMVSIIDSLCTRHDVIVYDSESHACIMDGIFLHKAKGGKSFVFPHNDMERAEKMLRFATKQAEENNGGILVITEGVFGMSGDLGNLSGIVALKKQFNFRLMIDDAHGFGTMGKTGAGASEHFGLMNEVDIYFATFAKSMAGIGAFVASDKAIVDS
ncbi:MAG: pyridoxal phosphate-dependent aminotransferase family protein, partial [Petrimonas sp.]|uniref:aminotransferase class I/II-fold pyridoxal phosphate-dependent enzyme n=1 Tax=Petrimonas sp. TaxID=2023866 RepID=UPI002B39BF2C|nr:pyridoxal phosphate-dependent aminotransferase family protein [Petrimonas sp.]